MEIFSTCIQTGTKFKVKFWINMVFVLFLVPCNLLAQVTILKWDENYGGTDGDEATDMIKINEKFLLLAGISGSEDEDVSSPIGLGDVWVCKIDTARNLLWEKSYGGSSIEHPYSLVKTPDSGFVFAGYSYSDDGDVGLSYGNNDGWIFKIDSIGNLVWSLVVGGSNSDVVNAIQPTADSGFVFTGYSHSMDGMFTEHVGPETSADAYIGKIDAFGNLLWLKNLGIAYEDRANDLVVAENGNIYICATKLIADGENQEYRIIKLDSVGNIIWDYSYGGTEYEEPFTIALLPNQDLLIAGEAGSHNGDVSGHYPGDNRDLWLVQLDSLGNIVWESAYGGSGADYGTDIEIIDSNNIIITGVSTSPNDGDINGHHGGFFYSDYWILKIDSIGVIQFSQCYGGSDADIPYAICKKNENSFYIVGRGESFDGDVTNHYGTGEYASDYWLINVEQTCPLVKYYVDADGDLFGDTSIYIYSCNDTVGYVLNNLDCNDNNPLIYPGANEIENNLDDDCNGLIDDNVTIATYLNSSIQIYPNPASNWLVISNVSGIPLTFSIKNAIGTLMQAEVIVNNTISIDISKYAAGLYIVQFEEGALIKSLSFIKD